MNMSQPEFEGRYHKLTIKDDTVWHLGIYLKCLQNWDWMNQCLDVTSQDISSDYGNMKYHMRYRGLEILRDVDNAVPGVYAPLEDEAWDECDLEDEAWNDWD